MSENNPFEKSVQDSVVEAYAPAPTGAPGPKSIPTGVMVVGIIGLLLGLLGLMGVCIGGFSLGMTETFVKLMPGEDVQEAFQKVMDLQFIPTLIQLTLSLILSPMLIAACIGCLTRKAWSGGLLKISLMGMIFSSVVSLLITVWLMLFHSDTLLAPSVAQMGGNVDAAKPGFYVGQAIAIGFALLYLVFFIWALIYARGKRATEYFDRIANVTR
ncbi:hypothetical protein [Mariniblastus fucicola]|uniref:Uncharacterized protein n=1 Tax=Mariniblastus fucicola TaxID=980251 RepID=A0A5B9P856_9BACT|nr:hypothetical protein [Mariniblastus fucicola]QEG21679.1 hypothetical protein MFFC18_15370 [Mariniblastus fucicola]